jgi:signal transduction histidine kinase
MFLPAHVAFNLLAVTPFMVRNFVEEGRLFVGQSFALLVFAITCLLFAQRQQATIRDAIRLRFANLDLLERLTRENSRAEAARRQAEAANSAKTRFLAAASHDLRQPLQAMTLFAHAVAQDVQAARLPETGLVGNLQSSCESLEVLLDSLLDLSRVEAGELKPDIRGIPLQMLFDRIRREFTDQAAAKGLRLRVVPCRHAVRSDLALLERMLRNLTANALRYTETGGVIIGCRRRGGRLRIEVRDSGIGIPEEYRAEIFTEFYQLGNPERDRHKGLGLGLAIVNALAHQLDHRVDVRSIPGRGSVFAIEVTEASPDALAPPTMAEPPDRLRGQLLAVIDDEAMIREAMTRLLGGWGCTVVTGENADEVLARLGDKAPSAILADWRLREGRFGTDEVARIRDRFGRAIPAALITGDTAPDAARNTGFPVIRKPVQGFRLRAELDALLAERDRPSPNV